MNNPKKRWIDYLNFYSSIIKDFFNSSAKKPNLIAAADISSIEAVCSSVEALIPSIEVFDV